MAALRACLIVAVLLGFFFLGAPLQSLLARRWPRVAEGIPLFFCRRLLEILRVEVVVSGEPLAASPVLVVANHISWIDILALNSMLPFCFVAKGEVGRWPILSALAVAQGTIFLDRRRRRSIPASNRRMAARMLEGRAVVLFPEGTTIAPPLPARFLSSHFAAARDLLRAAPSHVRVAVQPVAISYTSDAAAWVGDDDLVSHIWRTLRRPPLRCLIRFATPLDYREASNRKTMASLARQEILDMISAASFGPQAAHPTDASRRDADLATVAKI